MIRKFFVLALFLICILECRTSFGSMLTKCDELIKGRSFEEALRLVDGQGEEQNVEWVFRKAYILNSMAQYAESNQVVFEVLREFPDFTDVQKYPFYRILQKNYFGLRDYQSALHYLFIAQGIKPLDNTLNLLIAVAYHELGEFEKSNQAIDVYLTRRDKKDVQETYAYELQMRNFAQLNDLERYASVAIEYIDRFPRQGPSILLDVAVDIFGDDSLAYGNMLEEIHLLCPEDIQVLYFLGLYYQNKTMLEELKGVVSALQVLLKDKALVDAVDSKMLGEIEEFVER